MTSLNYGQARKQIEGTGDDSGPSRLVAGAESRAIVPVEIFVEQNVIFPMRIFLKLLSSTIDGPPTVGVTQEDTR